MTSGPVCDNYVVTFLGRKDSVRFISMVNLGDIPDTNLIVQAFSKFREKGCVTADIKVSVRGGWEKIPASRSLGEYLLNIIRAFRKQINTKHMWIKTPVDFSKERISMDPKCSFKGFSFNSHTGKISEIPKPIPESMQDAAGIIQRMYSFVQKTVSGEEQVWPFDLLPVGYKKPKIGADDSKKASSFHELSVLQTRGSSFLVSTKEMTKQIEEQWTKAFGSQAASKSEVVPSHDDSDVEKELAQLIKLIELRESDSVSSGSQEKNPKTKS